MNWGLYWKCDGCTARCRSGPTKDAKYGLVEEKSEEMKLTRKVESERGVKKEKVERKGGR